MVRTEMCVSLSKLWESLLLSTDAGPAENQVPEQAAVDQSIPAHHQESDVIRWQCLSNMWEEKETEMFHPPFTCLSSVVDQELTGQDGVARPAAAGVAAQLKPLMVAEQLLEKTRTWTDRHHVTRNTMQRHNRVRQGVQQSRFHLQQPGRRSLAHWGDTDIVLCWWSYIFDMLCSSSPHL